MLELGRDEHSSHHLVAIRGSEALHRHQRHAQTVIVLRGHGLFRFGQDSREVGKGSILHVPPGTPHAFSNRSDTPSAAYVIYTPPFDGKDREVIETPSQP